ncbi:MAG: alpha/beta hydrolase, partial [Actinomycetota bacterium]|nr:alpha/beta hydrolase [Actinomycetota bacterium]
MPVTAHDGVHLAVHDLGGRGPDVFMTHAAGFHGRVWAPVAHHLASGFHCLALDLRGHGDSGVNAAATFEWPRLATDVLAAVDALGLERPRGVGHSSGATLLLLAEARRPGTFAALYLVEPIGVTSDGPPPPPAPDHPLAVRARRRRDSFASLEEAEQAYAARPPFSGFAPEARRAYVEHGFADDGDGGVRLKCRPEHEARMYEHGLSHDVFRRLPDVRCPVVLARGERSDSVRAADVERWAERLPAARMEVLAGLGHLAPLEDPGA